MSYIGDDFDIRSIVGYFTGPDTAPAFDPGPDAKCPYCHSRVGLHSHTNPVKTISFADPERGNRSFFYRMHKRCHEVAPVELTSELESFFIDEGRREQVK